MDEVEMDSKPNGSEDDKDSGIEIDDNSRF
jgi:hypothetical protein